MDSYKRGFVYIITNRRHGILYIGVTSNLKNRISQHKEKIVQGFSKRYNLEKLVYFEECATIIEAITREKQLKNRKRQRKLNLIEQINPDRNDLFLAIL